MHPIASSRRRLLPLAAVLTLASVTVLPVSAASIAERETPVPVSPAAGRGEGSTVARVTPQIVRGGPDVDAPLVDSFGLAAPRTSSSTRSAVDLPAAQVKAESRAVRVATRSTAAVRGGAGSRSTAAAYRGRNHVWVPALGISRSVSFFPCDRSEPPGERVYRWGCAGANNVYLFAHASSLFRPLHDLYVSGRLRKGLKVVYADNRGNVRTYAVTFWKVVRPDGDIGWAYGAQSQPSLTLQTCVGRNSQYRLVVRLAATG